MQLMMWIMELVKNQSMMRYIKVSIKGEQHVFKFHHLRCYGFSHVVLGIA